MRGPVIGFTMVLLVLALLVGTALSQGVSSRLVARPTHGVCMHPARCGGCGGFVGEAQYVTTGDSRYKCALFPFDLSCTGPIRRRVYTVSRYLPTVRVRKTGNSSSWDKHFAVARYNNYYTSLYETIIDRFERSSD